MRSRGWVVIHLGAGVVEPLVTCKDSDVTRSDGDQSRRREPGVVVPPEGVVTDTTPPLTGRVRLTAWVHGRVQGVGFRWSTRARALELGLVGHAANLTDGRVEVVAEGPRDDCERLLAWLRGGSTPGTVRLVVERFDGPRGLTDGFVER